MANDKSNTRFIGRLFSQIKSFFKKETETEKFIKNQEQFIQNLKDLDLLDHLSSSNWQKLSDKDLAKLHKIIMTDFYLNPTNGDLSIEKMDEKIRNGVTFSKDIIISHIKQSMEIKNSDSPFVNGKISSESIAMVKEARAEHDMLTYTQWSQEVLEREASKDLKDKIQQNINKMNNIKDNYASKYMVIRFLSKFYNNGLPSSQANQQSDQFLRQQLHESFNKYEIYNKLDDKNKVNIFMSNLQKRLTIEGNIDQSVAQSLKYLNYKKKSKGLMEILESNEEATHNNLYDIKCRTPQSFQR